MKYQDFLELKPGAILKIERADTDTFIYLSRSTVNGNYLNLICACSDQQWLIGKRLQMYFDNLQIYD